MSTQYPNANDQFPVHADNVNEKVPAAAINNIQDAIVAIENRLGVAGLSVLPAVGPADTFTVVNHQLYLSDGTKWNAVAVVTTGANTFTGNQTAPRFVSNVAQGTAPLQVASTTVVQNLNSQLWDGANRTSAAAAPSNPNPGDEWYNTSTNRKLYWNGTVWVDPLKYQ